MTQQRNCTVTRCQAITDVIESVAKEQKALARILDKAHDKPRHHDSDFSDCSDFSSSDRTSKDEDNIKLINAVARLDFVLTFKLALFIDCACPKNGCCEHDRSRL
ncbi:hypothetical protein [Anaerosporobacter sp.]